MAFPLNRVALVCAAAFCVAGAAAAQAPIEYAGQRAPVPLQAASVGNTLSGGDENSYGYGAGARTEGAAIDIRRGSVRSAPAHVETAPASTEHPQWLERERVGPPYEANGRWYVPTPEPGYEQTGTASWYGPTFHGQATASGEIFDQEALTAAHPTLPIPSLVQVTNLENGREVIVRVNDRGPFVGERLIDLSRRSAEVLGFEQQGQARVHVRYLGPAPRRVAAEGSPAAHTAPPPAQPTALRAGEGPVSLLPRPVEEEPRAAALAGAPLGQPQSAPPRYSQPAGDGFYVQVGAYADLTNAHRVRDEVSAAGPVSVDMRQTAAGGELFRVRLGPWASREQADAARRQLSSLGYGESIVAAR
ncbi:MAG TPA: septal ring lytic transglycosylase RlpA family protein [Vitreimonas sp.]|uniref:septal ring lytic transglycosylase RlpA family protein n=1 Tax=Vitreimonas sp. TaxID=3069702 RepID=UPI002D2C2D54|nr:septal ring lytic transglycosylase RlpA family protein [Vitreimonas sp.]HYD87448.1 septal ring lytic transglycosylase RlpA family protein [Vitreimonas sp.]